MRWTGCLTEVAGFLSLEMFMKTLKEHLLQILQKRFLPWAEYRLYNSNLFFLENYRKTKVHPRTRWMCWNSECALVIEQTRNFSWFLLPLFYNKSSQSLICPLPLSSIGCRYSPSCHWGWEPAKCTWQILLQLPVRRKALERDPKWPKEKSFLFFAQTSQSSGTGWQSGIGSGIE